MWCFFDESWPSGAIEQRVGVLFAVLLHERTLERLEGLLYDVRKKYYGREHAKNRNLELSGSQLLSANTFKLAKKNAPEIPRNHCIVREILGWCEKNGDEHPINMMAATVYGVRADLTAMDPRALEMPFANLITRVSAEAQRVRRDVTLVFDQRLTAQHGIAIGIRNFLAGTRVPRVRPYPYFGVSHVVPAIQIADIGAFIVGRKAVGDPNFERWYRYLKALQWEGDVDGKQRFGFVRYDSNEDGSFTIRRTW